MKKDGVGGANTRTGLAFELKTDLPTFIAKQQGYIVEPNDYDIRYLKNGVIRNKLRQKQARWKVFFNSEEVGEIFQKYGLYRYFDELEFDYNKVISKKTFTR